MGRQTRDKQWLAAAAVMGALFGVFLCLVGCDKRYPVGETALTAENGESQDSTAVSDPNLPRPRTPARLDERRQMVSLIRDHYRLAEPKILQALENVPRHWFVPADQQRYAYNDRPLSIGQNQTISQPFIVAYMTYLLGLDKNKKVQEIGTGSGYQAAMLNEFTPHVYTIEILEPLGKEARNRFDTYGYTTITAKIDDGYKGWAEHAPFDAIIVTCAPDKIPKPLIEQLKPGGRMVIPVGGVFSIQELVLVNKNDKGGITKQSLMAVRFVPMLRK